MSALVWFNEDGLNPQHQMVQDYADSPKVYVFDVEYLQRWAIAKHRIQFIYESLLEIPNIEIYKGETVAVLRQLITDYGVNEVVTSETPNHLVKSWQDELLKYTSLITYPEVYPTIDSRPRRFSHYWRKCDREWLTL
ncbi:MAG: deoxyribodipyrimidine photo-lyase [Leptolyngbyaceae cyanobacterium RM2_2_4]|nr:deoxyribodipyrimidine photo-lyase [Leptolyngbyaceae cyanobacterium SM1_4_3]NJN91086.1 deoxyribodipyrimidine photo-lyase [Leptolyngbyaceae cyanobacterium SL_5_14]NJO50172.1 deoxyribodipyrimidine photo-lyase [Leptolyngbyaceae cyanobacterium RM2_2_4]